MLNHIISDVLAEGHRGGIKYSNSDPVTGQGSWYDLRVKITKCTAAESGFTEPMYEAFKGGPVNDAGVLRYGHDHKEQNSGGRADLKEFIGQRRAIAQTIPGVRDGHGNKIKEDQT